jgi:MFS family permease
MSLWFAPNAVAAQFTALWHLTPQQAGWLTTVVQLGFVAGTAVSATLNFADIFPARTLFSVSALLGAAANFSILFAGGFSSGLVARFATGFFLAGVYPPAMKMISTWFKDQRGLAIGCIVGALTIGKATPYLVHAFPSAGISQVISIASLCAIAGSLLIAFTYSDGPHAFASRRFSWGLVTLVTREREWRLATLSYLGHMFELYAFWTWIPVFLAASIAAKNGTAPQLGGMVSLISFSVIAVGGIGCVWGGLYADRKGRERLVRVALLWSGACCLLSALMFGAALMVVVPFAIVWGFFVIADSAQFSALVTESVPSHAVGTGLTLQTSLGFLLTMLPMQLVPWIAGKTGWQWALALLALGPAVGIAAIQTLAQVRRERLQALF